MIVELGSFNHQEIPDKVGNKMFMGYKDRPGLPQYSNSFKEGKEDVFNGLGKPILLNDFIQKLLKSMAVHIDRMKQELINILIRIDQCLVLLQYFSLKPGIVEQGYIRDFVAAFNQQGNIEYSLNIFIRIIPDVGIRSFRFKQLIPLFPYTDSMGFDPR
jgi:hypothetical protein